MFSDRQQNAANGDTNRTGGIGFLADPQRLNVALTRAKFSLFIVGNFSILQKSEMWRKMLNDAKMRRSYVDVANRGTKDTYRLIINRQK